VNSEADGTLICRLDVSGLTPNNMTTVAVKDRGVFAKQLTVTANVSGGLNDYVQLNPQAAAGVPRVLFFAIKGPQAWSNTVSMPY
jgi:hypothetical protein